MRIGRDFGRRVWTRGVALAQATWGGWCVEVGTARGSPRVGSHDDTVHITVVASGCVISRWGNM